MRALLLMLIACNGAAPPDAGFTCQCWHYPDFTKTWVPHTPAGAALCDRTLARPDSCLPTCEPGFACCVPIRCKP